MDLPSHRFSSTRPHGGLAFLRRTGIASAFAAALFLVGCSRPAPVEEPLRAVKVMTVGTAALEAGREFSGEVRARVETRLGFRVGGKMVARPAELGQRVKAGQVLAQLDPQDLRLSEDAARAQLAAAITNRDLAAADFKRFKELRDQNFISGAELERREASLKAAQAQVDQAQAQARGQGNQAAYTALVADAAGVITGVDAEVGQVVAAGTPVVRLAKDGPRDVVLTVPEDTVGRIQVGSAAQVQGWGAQTALAARVREVAASADPVTRTFQVKVALDGAQELPLGSTVTVRLQALQPPADAAIKLPTSALRQEGQGTAVWVLDTASMTVKSTPITVAAVDGNQVVVASGLQPGMQVVTAGVHVLNPGQKVTLYQAPALAQAGKAANAASSTPSK